MKTLYALVVVILLIVAYVMGKEYGERRTLDKLKRDLEEHEKVRTVLELSPGDKIQVDSKRHGVSRGMVYFESQVYIVCEDI